MEEIAAEFKQAKEELTKFKKDHDDIFKRLIELKKAVKELQEKMTFAMKENDVKIFDHFDIKFEKRDFGHLVHVSKNNKRNKKRKIEHSP